MSSTVDKQYQRLFRYDLVMSGCGKVVSTVTQEAIAESLRWVECVSKHSEGAFKLLYICCKCTRLPLFTLSDNCFTSRKQGKLEDMNSGWLHLQLGNG